MTVYEIDGVIPVIHPTAFVHDSAVLIGDVVIGPGCYVGPHASLRGDFGRIELREGSNVQDSTVLHCFPGQLTLVDVDGHVGHSAVLHGCTIGRRALVGIAAVVMDAARVGEGAFVGANSFVPAETDVPAGWVVTGTPARARREVTAEEAEWKANGTKVYQHLARRSRTTMKEAVALTEAAGRPQLPMDAGIAVPLNQFRQGRS
jgi:phenylacetic acid degradation protein